MNCYIYDRKNKKIIKENQFFNLFFDWIDTNVFRCVVCKRIYKIIELFLTVF